MCSSDLGYVQCLGVRLAGDLIGNVDDRGQPITGDTILLLLNAHHEPLPFRLPATKPEHGWQCLVDTAEPQAGPATFAAGATYGLRGRSMVVLRLVGPEELVTPAATAGAGQFAIGVTAPQAPVAPVPTVSETKVVVASPS